MLVGAEIVGESVEEIIVALVLGEAGDGADYKVVGSESHARAHGGAIFARRDGGVWNGVHPAADGGVLRGRADAASKELIGHGIGDAHDGVAVIGSDAFGDFVEGVIEGGLGASQV